MWVDGFIVNLEPVEKLLFTYLLISPFTRLSGCYEISVRQIAFDTGIDQEMVLKIIGKFEKAKKLIYQNGWIVLLNFLKNQNLNDNMKKCVVAEVGDAPVWVNHAIVTVIESSQSLSKAFESFRILRKDEVEVEGEVETEKEDEIAATPSAKKTPNTPLTIELIRTICMRYPPKVGWSKLVAAVGPSPNTEKLTECFAAWSLKGNKPTNYAWVTDWYVNGIPEYEAPKQLKGSPSNGSYDPKKDIMSAEYDMPPSRIEFEAAAEMYFTSHDDGTREKYESMKANWLEMKSAKGHENEIEEYERGYKFRQRFGETGQSVDGSSVGTGRG